MCIYIYIQYIISIYIYTYDHICTYVMHYEILYTWHLYRLTHLYKRYKQVNM